MRNIISTRIFISTLTHHPHSLLVVIHSNPAKVFTESHFLFNTRSVELCTCFATCKSSSTRQSRNLPGTAAWGSSTIITSRPNKSGCEWLRYYYTPPSNVDATPALSVIIIILTALCFHLRIHHEPTQQAVLLMPLPQLWAVLFFFMMFILGMGSQFGGIEAINTAVIDFWPHLRHHKWRVSVYAMGNHHCRTGVPEVPAILEQLHWNIDEGDFRHWFAWVTITGEVVLQGGRSWSGNSGEVEQLTVMMVHHPSEYIITPWICTL